ncbi:adenylate kinase isoenzyme 1 [Dermochelys coriacea]|uniref:adenylate kinase isoenzyme 1 n=1 Tax=Dermochelys coriacea TaxID=27794 RepID=UPI001CA9EFF7|nr:adenylate kinase isoenzyme 1 [Dermochelys coriacea]
MGLCQARLPKTAKPLKPELQEKLKSQVIVFVIGGPGSGKGTQCERLAAKYQFQHLGLGNLLRAEASQPTRQGRQIKDIMMKGALVPSGFILDLLNDNLLQREEAKGFLINGFPRELKQAKDFERVVGRPPNIVIVLDCSTETMIQRLLLRGQTGHRADDHEACIRQRLETHYSLCEPVISYYQQQNLLRNVGGGYYKTDLLGINPSPFLLPPWPSRAHCRLPGWAPLV